MTMRRAYSVFETKAIHEEKRTIEGIATTPAPDRYGDIVIPEGANFKLPLAALWQHSGSEPVGQVIKAAVTEAGITATIQMAQPKDSWPDSMREQFDKYWTYVKEGLVRGLSIGFRPLEHGYKIDPDSYTFIFEDWEWLELSLVTIPANAEATIQNVRCYAALRSAEVDSIVRAGTASTKDLQGVVLRGALQSKRVGLPSGTVARRPG